MAKGHFPDGIQSRTERDGRKAVQRKRYRRAYQEAKRQGESPDLFFSARDTAACAAGKASGRRRAGTAGAYSGRKRAEDAAAGLIVLAAMLVMSLYSGCAALLGSGAAVISTTYPGESAGIRTADEAYRALERELDAQVNGMERTHPGYDEYRYQVDEITHDPFQLASLLSARFGSYGLSDVEGELPAILNLQYELAVAEETEMRTRTSADPETGEVSVEEYEHRILDISLTNFGLDRAAGQYLTESQYGLYRAYNATKGNRKELFDEEEITADPSGGAGGGAAYDIPPEALSDERFARMIREAEKYLGYPYVWGGSSPSTSFDCSGFVSWVVNNSGNGWNVGRQTAEGLRRLCTPVPAEDARPGDLVFFQGTYSTNGASHIGIYAGGGMMIHCGKPVQYTSINTPYWKQHFYMFGRLA
ncbi:MAG: C40 family peptidase [Lachnospiraceae bacterium]|nr:C40 family peptidase [Lachnospiraceae bacterium]